MYIKKTFLFLLCSLVTVSVCAQDVRDLPFRKRLFFGGDIGFSFGTNTYINLSPFVGYRFTNRLPAGLGPIYIFEKSRYYDFQTSTYGGRVLLSFAVVKDFSEFLNMGIGNILLHLENEVLNVQKLEYSPVTGKIYALDERLWIDNVLAGIGLNFPFGERAGINAYVLWDITQNEYSPHSNPIIRLGFYF